MPDLLVDFDRFGRASLPAERLAYIAFYQDVGPRSLVPPADEEPTPALRIHVAGGKSFLVSVRKSPTVIPKVRDNVSAS
jgi:hypothetical protein